MSDVRRKAGKAMAWELLGNYGGQLAAFAISVVLARLLNPSDFGIVAMSMVFISLLTIFADMGFAAALVQSKDNTSLTYSSIFYLNIGAGALFTVAIYFAAPLVAAFYDNPLVAQLVRVFSITFVLNSFNIVHTTILKRDLNFKALTIRDLSAQVVAGAVAIILAFRGMGIYALVIQQIIAAILKTILLWRAAAWTPKLEFSWTEVKRLTQFSAYVFAAQSMNQLIMNIDVLVIGKLFNASTLGYFTRANSINTLISTNSVRSLNKVFYPVLSSVQDDDSRFKSIYLKVVSIVAGLSVFLSGVFFLCGEELIIGLFGEKWQPSVFIFNILIIKAFTFPISAMIVNAFLAKGKSKENFHYGNIRKVLQLLPLVIAYFYGFEAFLYALVGFSILSWLLNNYFITRTLSISFAEQVNAVLIQLIVAAALVTAISYAFPNERNYVHAVLKVAIFASLFTLYSYLTGSVLWKEFDFYRQKVWKRLRTY